MTWERSSCLDKLSGATVIYDAIKSPEATGERSSRTHIISAKSRDAQTDSRMAEMNGESDGYSAVNGEIAVKTDTSNGPSLLGDCTHVNQQ